MAVQQSLVSIITPIKGDVLVLRQAKFIEELGKSFSIEVELFSSDEAINFEELLGKTMTISMETQAKSRYFNGIVTGFCQRENVKRNAVYVATLRPWLWLLSLSQQCRIFQQKSYPEIIKAVFIESGFTDFEDKLTSKYPKQEYFVQFNESDLDFVTRIMQQEGIFFTFEHSKNKHTLLLHDDNARLLDIGKAPYIEHENNSKHTGLEGITFWETRQQVKSGGFTLSSFDFKLPTKNLRVTSKDPKVKSASALQKYAFEGHYNQRQDGENYSKLLMEQENVSYSQTHFSGNQRALSCGIKFQLNGHVRDDQNVQYVITRYECLIRSNELIKDKDLDNHTMYEFSATAIPATMRFRPAKSIPEPTMRGPQTATVVGKNKEEIWTDKYGRIKVKFHWDERSKGDESSSCWIRVSQSMSGKNWGSIYIPRVGQEVLVDFMQGDPNQPIVIGCVYNGSNLPPYTLPNHATLSGFRSRSTENAGTFNEIRFEDKKGEEQLFIHAAKNQDISVTKDCFETVGADRHLTIKQDQHTKVKNSRFESIGADKVQKVGKDLNLSIDGKEAKEVGQSISLNVRGNGSEDYEGGLSINVDKDTYIKSNNICLEASNNLTLQVGSSFIAIERGGITISTPGKVVVEAKASINLDAGASVDVSASGAASIKAASVNIN